MPVAFDAVGPSSAGASAAGASSLTWSHTNAGNAIIAGAAAGAGNDAGMSTTATYAGVTMTPGTPIHTDSSTVGFLRVFTLLNPAAGANNVVITLAGGVADLTGGSISTTGAGSFAPQYTGVSAGASTPATATSAGSTPGGLICAFQANGGGTNTATAPSTSRFIINLNGSTGAGNSAGATSPSTGSNVTTAWALVGPDFWAVIGVEVLPIPPSGAAPTQFAPGRGPRGWQRLPRAPKGEVVAVGGQTFPISLDGTVTATGSLLKQTQAPKVGSSTATGALVKQVQKPLGGSSSSSATLIKQIQRLLGGSSSVAGQLTTTRVVLRSFAGTVTATGSLLKSLLRLFTGSATPAGVVQKQAQKKLAGSSSPSGLVSTLLLKVIQLAGSVTSAGLLTKQVGKPLSGSSTLTGVLVRQAQKRFAGSSSASGTLATTKVLLRSFAGSLSASGALVRSVQRSVGGNSTVTGTISKQLQRRFTASSSASGNLALIRNVLRSFSGNLTISGAITKRVSVTRAGTVAAAGVVTKQIRKQFVGSVTAQGLVTFFMAGAVALYARIVAMVRTREAIGFELRQVVRDLSHRQVIQFVRRWSVKYMTRRQD